MALVTQRRSSGGGGLKRVLAIVVVGGLVMLAVVGARELRLPPPAAVELVADKPAIGRKTIVSVSASEPTLGVESVTVTADGAGLRNKPLAAGAGDVAVGKEAFPELVPGKLTITVTVQARGTRLRRPDPVVVTKTFDVRLDPPSLAASSQFIYITQGGVEAVVYDVGATAVKDGVQAGGWFFPGYALPGGAPTQRFAFFAAPYDWDGTTEEDARAKILLVAEDDIGNRAEQRFIHKWFPRPMGKDVIELKEPFMQKVTGEIYSRTPELAKKGDLLADTLQLNGDLRRKNMAELRALKSQPKFLWSTTFAPMQNAAVKGSFADRRTYMHDGQKVDTQDHLGFDLASVEHASVQAANAGVVLLARYFGIFGNCVVLDHGYGLMSLYAHLSTIAVKEGEVVAAGQEIGRTGATGLAGGDHLHFTMVLDGLPVTPVEWWDAHWIKDRLKLKLGDALPWTPK